MKSLIEQTESALRIVLSSIEKTDTAEDIEQKSHAVVEMVSALTMLGNLEAMRLINDAAVAAAAAASTTTDKVAEKRLN